MVDWLRDLTEAMADVVVGLVIFNLAIYWLFVGGSWLLIRLLPTDFARTRRIGRRKIRPGQLRREMLTSTRSALIFAAVATVAFALGDLGVLKITEDSSSLTWLIVSSILIIVVQDTWFYWTHRAMHHPRLFRRFHSVHHKSKYPTPNTAYAFDSGEAFVNAVYIAVFAIVVPISYGTLAIFMIHMIARNAWGHSGYEIQPAKADGTPRLDFLTTTSHHDLHHTDVKGNFGLYFTFWDRVMGTEHPDYHDRFRANVGHQGRSANPVATA